jgi:hypothetical protein
MRQILSILLLSILFFCSCHKNDVPPKPPVAEVSFKKDGVEEKLMPQYCSIRPNASWPTTMTDFTLSANSSDFKTFLGITLQVSGELKTGTYDTNTSGCYVIADYMSNVGDINEKDYAVDNADNHPPGNFKVTITSISADWIKGTFSCNYLYERTYNEFIVLTEGNFSAKRHN